MGTRVDVRRADALLDDLPRADVIVANIELAPVEALVEWRPGRTVVTSGYLAHEAPRAEGWKVVHDLELDGWTAHV